MDENDYTKLTNSYNRLLSWNNWVLRNYPRGISFFLSYSWGHWTGFDPISKHSFIKVLIWAISTGIGIKMPWGHFGLIKEHFSLVLKGICVHGGSYRPTLPRRNPSNSTKWRKRWFTTNMIYQLLILPCVTDKSTKRRMFLLTNRGDGGFGSTNEIHVIEAKVWVKQPNSPPLPADFTEQGKDNTILVMIPGQEKWKYVPFSSVAQSCPTLWDPMNRSMPGLPVHHQLLESTQTHVHRGGDAIQPSHPLSAPSPPAPNPSQH